MMNLLLIDNYDSFTYNLYDYFLQLGAACRVIRNDEISLEELSRLSFDALVISPGPKKPDGAGLTLPAIQHFSNQKPILGICLGHQALGQAFGARLNRASVPMHGKTSRLNHKQHPIFKGLPPSFQVMRYHSLLLEELDQQQLSSIAWTEEGEIMALAHLSLPHIGLQFHPESILTEYGLDILKNWMEWILD
jgi:anthranilate synthase/aminodeoxychorismate synthase-like glutamine amidotransferase